MTTSGVQFEEDSFSSNSSTQSNTGIPTYSNPQLRYSGGNTDSGSSGMSGWLVKKGLVSSPEMAQKILLGVVIANFFIAMIVLYFFL